MIPRLAILAGGPASDPSGAMGDAGLGQIGSRLNVVEEGRRLRPRRREIGPNLAAGP